MSDRWNRHPYDQDAPDEVNRADGGAPPPDETQPAPAAPPAAGDDNTAFQEEVLAFFSPPPGPGEAADETADPAGGAGRPDSACPGGGDWERTPTRRPSPPRGPGYGGKGGVQAARRPAPHRSGGGASRVILALAALMLAGVLLFGFFTVAGLLTSLFAPAGQSVNPPDGTFSVITIQGTIQGSSNDPYSTSSPGYYHSETVAFIKALAENEGNAGILLYMNTGGGGVYESDELYTALMAYKEKTGRPIWAYMGSTCASGGYYVCAAADHLVANLNTTTGSIGVYIALTDTSGLYEKLGIETVLVRSGDNKGTGVEGVPITDEQRAVYQSVVDESYERFISLVAAGRGMPLSEVRKLSDGRVYTGTQALELGLVDELGEWDSTLEAFGEETGATAFYPSFSRQTRIARLLGNILGELPQGDAESMLEAADAVQSGVPMALYRP